MKITSFHPLILSKDAASVIATFEALGSERRHTITITTNERGTDVTTVCMKDADGHCVDVADVPSMPQDRTLIRMNVDDFDEAFAMLTAKGFKAANNDCVETKTNKSCMMVSPSGFAFDLCQHIKD